METKNEKEYKQQLNSIILKTTKKEIQRYKEIQAYLEKNLCQTNMEIDYLTQAAEKEKSSIPDFDKEIFERYKKYFVLEQKISDLKESANKLMDKICENQECIMETEAKMKESEGK